VQSFLIMNLLPCYWQHILFYYKILWVKFCSQLTKLHKGKDKRKIQKVTMAINVCSISGHYTHYTKLRSYNSPSKFEMGIKTNLVIEIVSL